MRRGARRCAGGEAPHPQRVFGWLVAEVEAPRPKVGVYWESDKGCKYVSLCVWEEGRWRSSPARAYRTEHVLPPARPQVLESKLDERHKAANGRRADLLRKRVTSPTKQTSTKPARAVPEVDPPPGVPVARFDESRLLRAPTDELSPFSHCSVWEDTEPSPEVDSPAVRHVPKGGWMWEASPEQELVGTPSSLSVSLPVKTKLESWTPRRANMLEEDLAEELCQSLADAHRRHDRGNQPPAPPACCMHCAGVLQFWAGLCCRPFLFMPSCCAALRRAAVLIPRRVCVRDVHSYACLSGAQVPGGCG
jgi:hypothetical protein